MRILMLVRGEYETDIRIRREAEALVSKGNSVHIICKHRDGNPTSESINGVDVTRIRINNRISQIVSEGIYGLTWCHPIVFKECHSILQENKFDIIYFHDIHYAKIAVRLSNIHNLKVVADLHEMYPQDVKTWRESNSLRERLRLKTLLTPAWRFQRLERFAVNHSDALITVSQGLLNYFVKRYDYEGQTGLIRNVPDVDRLDNLPVEDLGYNNELVLSYIGGFTRQRGLEIAIKAMTDISEEVPDSKLLLVGDSHDDYIHSLKRLCSNLGVEEHVEFTGWVDFEKVPSYYNISDITLAPIRETHAANDVLPNKMFQSMAFRTPVIVSDIQSMKEIIDDTGAGVVFGDGTTLSEAILQLYKSPKKSKDMGRRGRKAIEQKYNIKTEIEVLIDIIDSFSSYS